MKRILSVLKFAGLVCGGLVLLLFIVSQVMQEKVAEVVINSLNRNISTKLEAGSYRLSFLRRFPLASLELRNVLVHSSQKFDRSAFDPGTTDTLLAAPSVSVEFRLRNVLTGNYRIERIGAKSGKLILLADRAGKVNYEITEENGSNSEEAFRLDLEKIYLTDMLASYTNLAADLLIEIAVKDGRLKIGIDGDDIDLVSTGKLTVRDFRQGKIRIARPLDTEIDMDLLSNSKGVTFRKAILEMDGYSFTAEGSAGPGTMIDLRLTGNNVDISRVKDYLPAKYYDYVSKYEPRGILEIGAVIKGESEKPGSPHIEVSGKLEKGTVEYGKSSIGVRDLSFSAFYTNGAQNSSRTSSLTVKNFRVTLGSSGFTGSFSLRDFSKPAADLSFNGRIIPAEIREFLGLSSLSTAGGSADVEINMRTSEWPSGDLSAAALLSLNPSARISFNSLSLGFNHDSLLLRNITGDAVFGELSRSAGMSFNYNGQQVSLSGEFENLPGWIAGDGSVLKAEATASFSRFIPEIYMAWGDNDTLSGPELPDDIIADISFRADTIEYKKLSALNVSGKLLYKPKTLSYNSLFLNTLNGSISGNGLLSQNVNGTFISRGSYILDGINIKKAFISFGNFGQDFIKAENISGDISGTLSVLLPMNSFMVPQTGSITAEGHYLITEGALTDFEPVKELSDFIELSELQNIRFEELENDFYIRSNNFHVPQMEVRSSAADLSISGIHSFGNNYEYHVRILLSELLSGKRRRNSGPVTEFGAVEDDGLGRTSILLKVVGTDDDVKVSYDMKAASSGVKTSMKKEKENIKSILNQEYGWYQGDSAATEKPAAKKQRFRISWDEADVNKAATAPPPDEKKESGLKKIFKKKEN